MQREHAGELRPHVAKLRIFYGAPDPSDESRILIPYECDGEKGRFVGTLKATPSGEKIEWEVEGPVKPWPKE